MSIKTGWTCVRGLEKAAVLETLGLDEAEETGAWIEFDLCGGELPGGWIVVVGPYGELPPRADLEALSTKGEVLTCEIHEGVMCSMAQGFREGRLIWSVEHDVQSKGHGLSHLAAEGEPPPAFEEIKARLLAKQEAEGGEEAGVDYVFEAPAELVYGLCGFRADGANMANEPIMTELTRAGRSAPRPRAGSKSLLGWLFGRG